MRRILFLFLSLLSVVTAAAADLGRAYPQGDRVLLSLNRSALSRRFLLSGCVARSSNYKWMEVGTRPYTYYIYIVIDGQRALLMQKNEDAVDQNATTPNADALRQSHGDVCLATFPVTAADKTTVTMDISRLVLTDSLLSPFSRWFRQADVTLAKDRCRFLSAKSFDDNLLIRNELSFDVVDRESHARSRQTAQLAISLLALPTQPMRPRLTDPRAGFFSTDKTDFDFSRSDFYRHREFVERFRVEPTDYALWQRGELTPVKQPIVYYIDNRFPESWKAPIRRGILAWNPLFRQMGLDSVLVVKEYPADDPSFDEDNLRYNCIRYIPTDRGGSQGPAWTDPSTGEVINGSVYIWASMAETQNKFLFVQTAQCNPAIRAGRMPDDQWADELQCTISHEIGHNLGLAHNMAGTSAYPVDSLLNADFVRQNGLTASTMDYVYCNFILPPGQTDVPITSTRLGLYDKMILEYIYRPTDPALSVDDDAREAATWLDRYNGNPRCRYVEQQWGNMLDPTCVIYDIGDDPIRVSTLAVKNLHYVLSHMAQWLPGGNLAEQRAAYYDELQKQLSFMVNNVSYLVGGLIRGIVGPDRSITAKPIMAEEQRAALGWTCQQLRTLGWLDEPTVTATLEPALPASQTVGRKLLATLLARVKDVRLTSQTYHAGYTAEQLATDLCAELYAHPYSPQWLKDALKDAAQEAKDFPELQRLVK